VKPGSTEFKPSHFLHPRYWPTWLGLGLLRLLVLLPYGWQLKIGAVLGRIIKTLAPRRQRIAAANIALSFPELNTDAQRELVNRVFDSVGIAVLESGLAWWGTERRLAPLRRGRTSARGPAAGQRRAAIGRALHHAGNQRTSAGLL
jgi:KDO2-lipid IV(A) lauroyltransferase